MALGAKVSLSSAVQWPDGENESEPAEHHPVCSGAAPRRLVHLSAVGGICAGLYALSGLRSSGHLPLHGCPSPPFLTTRRKRKRKMWRSGHTFVVAGESGGRYVRLYSVSPSSHNKGLTAAGSQHHATTWSSEFG